MQTILGSNGQIGQALANELYENYTQELRLVSRHPHKIHATDEIMAANLLNYDETYQAIQGSSVVYFTVGLPYELWDTQFPTILENVIKACQAADAKLAYFDNTYMYAKDSHPQFEDSPFVRIGHKSTVRADMATTLLQAMQAGKINAVIGRAPEFYGPDQTQSITNTMIFNRIKNHKRPLVPLSATSLRTLIWTPDASRALARLGNTDSAYGQTWHLPTADSISYQNLIEKIEKVTDQAIPYTVIPMWLYKIGQHFNQNIAELMELLPRYQVDNVFNSDKFKKAFPDFQITDFETGIRQIFN